MLMSHHVCLIDWENRGHCFGDMNPFIGHIWTNVTSCLLLMQEQLVGGLLVPVAVFTCFTPLPNSTEPMSKSKCRLMRNMRSLHRSHVIGFVMPTTAIRGSSLELLGGSLSPGCEPNSLCFCPANTSLALHSFRPCSPVKGRAGRAGRTHTPDHCRCSSGCFLQVRPFFQPQSPGEQAARPPSSRHEARLKTRCIGAERTLRKSRLER